MKKSLKPSLPNCVPNAEEQQEAWLENYKVQLPVLGPDYGLSDASIAAALLAINGLLASLGMLRAIRAWLGLWVGCLQEQQYDKPKDASVVVKWPELPNWMALPAPITVNAWQPIIETINSFQAKSSLSQQDKETLGLMPSKPEKRRANSAEQYDWPLIQLGEAAGSMVVRTFRGSKYRGKLAKYVIDYNNSGTFTELTTAVDKDVLVPIKFPEGASIMTWTIRAVYMQNGNEFGQWSPPLSIVLRNSAPTVAPAAPVDLSSKLALAVNGIVTSDSKVVAE